MKRCLRWFARLYPAAWRTRYGWEFDALLDDLRPTWRDILDIIHGAVLMQLSTPAAYLKLGAVSAVLGAILAAGYSFTIPRRYVSTAILRIGTVPGFSGTPSKWHVLALSRLNRIEQEILSRGSLAEMIQRPNLNLYVEERKGHPLEDIVQGMRTHDIRIQLVSTTPSQDAMIFRIDFANSDPARAQAVARALTEKFASAPGLEVLDPANLPTKAVSPNPLRIAVAGLAGGFVLGLLIAFCRRHGLGQTGALYLKYAVTSGAVAGIVSGLASYAIPDRYISTAVLRAIPSDLGQARQLDEKVLSRTSLAAIIQRPQLDLYHDRRLREPLEEVVQQMRRDIRIQSARGQIPAFTVQFEYPDRFKAQAVVRELVARFIDANLAAPAGATLEVLDPASLPASPFYPNRLTITALGLAAGSLLGFLIGLFRARPPTPRPPRLAPDPSAA